MGPTDAHPVEVTDVFDAEGAVQPPLAGTENSTVEPAAKLPAAGAVKVNVSVCSERDITVLGDTVIVPSPELAGPALTVRVKVWVALGRTPFEAVIVIT